MLPGYHRFDDRRLYTATSKYSETLYATEGSCAQYTTLPNARIFAHVDGQSQCDCYYHRCDERLHKNSTSTCNFALVFVM